MAEKLDIPKLLSELGGGFESRPFYSSEGDCVFFHFEDADHFAERIDCWLTVYRSFDDRRLVGFKLKNVRTLLSAFDTLNLDITRVASDQWVISLKAFLAALPWVQPETASREPYRSLFAQIKSTDTVELCPA